MSGADPRYYQLWAQRQGTSVGATPGFEQASSSATPTGDTSAQNYRVDLNVPGGITYAPSDEVANHGVKRRLFLPRRGAIDEEYDFGYDIAQENKRRRQREAEKRQQAGESATAREPSTPFVVGDEADDAEIAEPADTEKSSRVTFSTPSSEEDKTDAQRFKETIDLTPRDPAISLPYEQNSSASQPPPPAEYAQSVAPSHTHSVRSTVTASGLAASRGLLDRKPLLDGSGNVVAFKPPPSISGDTYRSIDPWNAPSIRGRSEFDRITEEERDRDLTRAEEYGGEGNVPTKAEVQQNAERDVFNIHGDAATIRTAATTKTVSGSSALRISDIFIPDPRPYRPLRLIRRTDPRQILVVCSSIVLSAQEAASTKAAQQASMQGLQDMKTDEAKRLLATFGSDETGEVRAGLGVYFCPSAELSRLRIGEDADSAMARNEENFSRRMERVSFPNTPSPVRAGLRSVLAALEYLRYPEEGFDKIVVGVRQEWLVKGITTDIHEWRRNDWQLVRTSTALGHVGDTVPDRDLWEMLDGAVRSFEKIDVNVRFWMLARDEPLMAEATDLARKGACKDNQQPAMVKWTKKRVD